MAAKKTGSAKQLPLLEWLTAAAGVIILAAMLGFLAVDAFKTEQGRPPLLEVEPARVVADGGQYIVEIRVRNRSRHAAAAVHVEGVLKQGGAGVETSTATMDYVPGRSEHRGGLIFTSDPRRHRIETRVTGYARP